MPKIQGFIYSYKINFVILNKINQNYIIQNISYALQNTTMETENPYRVDYKIYKNMLAFLPFS